MRTQGETLEHIAGKTKIVCSRNSELAHTSTLMYIPAKSAAPSIPNYKKSPLAYSSNNFKKIKQTLETVFETTPRAWAQA